MIEVRPEDALADAEQPLTGRDLPSRADVLAALPPGVDADLVDEAIDLFDELEPRYAGLLLAVPE